MAKTNNVKLTIGGPEGTPGSAETVEYVIPIRGVPGIDKTAERQLDPAILGLNMDAGEYVAAEDVKGPIQLAFRPCGGIGQLLKSLLGTEQVPFKVGACARVRYTGAEASCKIVPTNGPVTVLCNAGGVDNVNYDAAYYLLTNGITTFYVWTNVAAGSTDPGDEGEPLYGLGYTGVEVAITTAHTPAQIAGIMEPLVEALTGINSTVADATVSIAASTTAFSVAGLGVTAVFTVKNTGTLVSSIGELGDEVADNNFGVAGTLDLALAANDTVGELVAIIEAYADYDCELVCGSAVVLSGSVMVFVSPGNYRQGKSTWVYLWFGLPSSTVFKHEFVCDLSDTERPTYTIQKDGYEDNFTYDGCVVDRLSISGALKAQVESDCDILGMKETDGETASELTMEDVDPMMFWNGSTSLGEVEYSAYVRKLSVEFRNNQSPDGYGQGLITRQYQQKAKFEASGSVTVRLDSDSYLERAKVFDGTLVAISFWLQGKTIAASLPELCIVELPKCTFSTFDYEENNGVFDAKIDYKVLKPKGTLWNDPVTVTILTTDAAAY